MSAMDSLLVSLTKAVPAFFEKTNGEVSPAIEWQADPKSRSWTRSFLYELEDGELLDFEALLQLTSIAVGEDEIPVLQLSFFALDGIKVAVASAGPLHRALADLNADQIGAKWTVLLNDEQTVITGLCVIADTFVRDTLDAELLNAVYTALLSALTEAYETLNQVIGELEA